MLVHVSRDPEGCSLGCAHTYPEGGDFPLLEILFFSYFISFFFIFYLFICFFLFVFYLFNNLFFIFFLIRENEMFLSHHKSNVGFQMLGFKIIREKSCSFVIDGYVNV